MVYLEHPNINVFKTTGNTNIPDIFRSSRTIFQQY